MAVFARTVELGGLAAAAEHEGMSATMAGNHLRALEARLGAKLLNRTTRRQSLTDAGRVYYEQCRAILHLVAEADAGVAATQEAPRGRLRVAAPVTFGTERLTPLIGDFLARFPEVDVDLSLSDRVVDLVDEGFDAALRIGALPESALVARPLAPYRMWVCAAPSYLRRRGVPRDPEDLAAHDCLVFSYAGGQWRFGAAPGEDLIAARGRFIANNGQALRVAARDGLGIVMQPEVLLADDVADGRLVRLFPDRSLPSRPMSLVYLRDRRMPPKLRAFVAMVVERFGRAEAPSLGEHRHPASALDFERARSRRGPRVVTERDEP